MKNTTLTFFSPVTFLLLPVLSILLFSCKPYAHLISQSPINIVYDDSIKLNWTVKGTPTLLYRIDSNDKQHELRVFRLIAEKNGKEASDEIQFEVWPKETGDDIVIDAEREGDMLVAKDEKNEEAWGHLFKLTTVSSASGRALTVKHGGITVQLKGDGSPSDAFKGLPNSGKWEISTPLTEAEKRDSTTIPPDLTLHTTLSFTKN